MAHKSFFGVLGFGWILVVLFGIILLNSCTENPAAAPYDEGANTLDTVWVTDTVTVFNDTLIQLDTIVELDTIIDTVVLDSRDTIALGMVCGSWTGQGGEWESLVLNSDGTAQAVIAGEQRESNWGIGIDTIYFNNMPLNELRFQYIEYVDNGKYLQELSFYNRKLIARFLKD